MKSKKSLTFFVTINKKNGELALQEGTLLSLKIPKNWQKPDTNIKNPALWVCHLPQNSLGIIYISLYPTELVIKKKGLETDDSESLEDYEKELEEYEMPDQREDNLLVYKGTLEPNGENDKENFFRCRLKLQKEKEKEEVKSGSSGAVIAVFLIIFIILIGIGAATGGFR